MMNDNYIKLLADILWKAQGRIDAETGETIDSGDEVQRLRNICYRLQVDSETLKHVSEQSQRVPEKISDYGHPDYSEVWGYYMEGWNDCIDEMLATAPKPGGDQ